MTFTAFYLITEWITRIIMLIVVTRKRRPTAALAWAMIIFVQPFVGLGLYLFIGRDRLPQRRISQHARLLQRMQSIRKKYEHHPAIVHPELDRPMDMAVNLAERLSQMPILGGNELKLFTETDDVIDGLIADIDHAQKHVHLMFFIFAADETGRRVVDALERAIERGVACRVLVDDVGSPGMLEKFAPRMREKGIEVAAALPVNIFRSYMQRIDLRNHRKLAVIDGRTAWTGSQNIVNRSKIEGGLAWFDMMMRIEGPVVLTLQLVFLQDWFFDSGKLLTGLDVFPEPKTAGSIPIQVLPSGPNYPTESYQRIVVAAIYAARERVVITTPYFIPDEALLQAMEVAALRGVKVDLIVPFKTDQRVTGAAARAYYKDVLSSGVNVYLFYDGLVHSKTMTIDDSICFFGSSNFDIRSFALNFELNLVIYDEGKTKVVRDAQLKYLEQSIYLTRERWEQRSMFQRIFENFAKLFSPLL